MVIRDRERVDDRLPLEVVVGDDEKKRDHSDPSFLKKKWSYFITKVYNRDRGPTRFFREPFWALLPC